MRVEKQWNDNNNAAGARPDSITVNIMNGDEIVATHKLDTSNSWRYTFTGLARSAKGKVITYTVEEEPVEGYTPNYVKSTTGYIIENEYTGGNSDNEGDKDGTNISGGDSTNNSDTPSLNHDDHYAYIIGYPNGDVKPNGMITRAEVATIFFRLLTDESRAKYWGKLNSYSDVKDVDWFNNAISTISNAGIVKGYLDGSFRPAAPITRAEFAAIAARFDSGTYRGDDRFTDIDGHWANEYINRAAARGWIKGYGDGTFKPNQPITRAEAMTLINGVLNRVPESAGALSGDMITWSDNANMNEWYYIAVQEATNSHYWEPDGNYEKWLGMREVRDWSALEQMASTSSSAGSQDAIYEN